MRAARRCTTVLTLPQRLDLGCGARRHRALERVARVLLLVLAATGCKSPEAAPPPPDVSRPQLKTQAELAQEREAQIAAGELVPTSSPAIGPSESAGPASRPQRPRLDPAPGSIQADILLVNDAVLTVPEVLYPIRDELAELARTRTRAGFREEARRLIRRRTQEEVGTLLIYAEARRNLKEEQQKGLDAAIDKELENQIARVYEGSEAKVAAHLKEFGLTRDQLRDSLGRQITVREYSREKLMPQIQVRREELFAFYRDNLPRYSTDETRELLLIELPFAKFLAEGFRWETAPAAEKAQAKLKAMRRAREAHAALELRSFADVAAEFSLGPHADGSFGPIARPLQAPYDAISKLIFEFQADQYSEPLETDVGWYIVGCGAVQPATQRSFTEVQEEIRKDIMERRFNKLSIDYVLRLAGEATISALDPFLNAALERAERIAWESEPAADG